MTQKDSKDSSQIRPKRQLTDVAIRKLQAPDSGRTEIPDVQEGLWLRIARNGRKVWVFRKYRRGLGEIRKTYGPYPAVSLSEARRLAKVDGGIMANNGDPRTQKSTDPDMSDLLQEYLGQHVDQRLKPKSAKEYRRVVERELLPSLGSLKVTEVSRQNVSALLNAIEKRGPVIRNRTQAILSSAFGWAIDAGWPVSNSCQGLRKSVEKKRRRILQEEELAAVWQEMEAYNGVGGKVLQIMLLTGQRGVEARNMHTDHLRVEREASAEGTWWEIADNKSGRPHSVFLVRRAVEIVEKQAEGTKGLVFAGKSAGVPLRQDVLVHAAARINRRLGCSNPWTPHDLRRTLETNLARLGVDPFVVDRVTNHAIPGVRDRYNQWTYRPEKRAALMKWESYLEGFL